MATDGRTIAHLHQIGDAKRPQVLVDVQQGSKAATPSHAIRVGSLTGVVCLTNNSEDVKQDKRLELEYFYTVETDLPCDHPVRVPLKMSEDEVASFDIQVGEMWADSFAAARCALFECWYGWKEGKLSQAMLFPEIQRVLAKTVASREGTKVGKHGYLQDWWFASLAVRFRVRFSPQTDLISQICAICVFA